MRQEQSGKTRRQNFDAYYKANPGKLNGKSLDEAYAAMQRQSTRNNAPEPKRGMAPAVADRQAAIQRRIQQTAEGRDQTSKDNPMTWKNTNPLSGVSNPLANKNGKTPWQRLNGEVNHLAHKFNSNAQKTVDKNPLAHMGNPLANKNGQTPVDRLLNRKRSKENN